MKGRLTILLGADFEAGLIRGLIRNGHAVLWHREGEMAPGFRRGCRGVDWVYRGGDPTDWKLLVAGCLDPDRDRCLRLVAPAESRPMRETGLRDGALPWPVSLRQLLTVLGRPPEEPGHQFRRFCQDSFAEWETVHKAKEKLIHRLNCSEPEAYAVLRRMSMDRCLSIREVARHLMSQG